MYLIAVYAPDVCKLDVRDVLGQIHIWIFILFWVTPMRYLAATELAEMSVDPHGSGVGDSSENSLLFWEFVRSHKLRISDSWY